MINAVLSRRIAKLESVRAAMHLARAVERHIISDKTDAARQARIASILEGSDGNMLHIFRVIVSPAERDAA